MEKSIQGFTAYTISTEGVLRRRGKEVLGYINPRGYVVHNLRQNGKRRTCKAHTLVLESFVGGRQKEQLCRHLNGVPSDNRLENLQWGTPQQNSNDMMDHGRAVVGERQKSARLTEFLVLELRRRVSEGETVVSVAAEWNMPEPRLRGAANGTKWKHLPGAIKRTSGPKPRILSCSSKVRALG